MCNTEECAGPYEDFRAQQCTQRSNKYHKNVKHTWLPYEHPDESRKCELSCLSKETGEVVSMNQVMHDGTRCSYSDPFSVCARGECLHVGCDKEVGSYKAEDKCGVCEGDNSHCRTVKLTLTKTPKKNGMLKMFDIPIGARHIVIEENETSPHVIAVKNQVTGNFILNAKSEEAAARTFIENGLQWEYDIDGEKETLKTSGPLHEGIIVLVIPQEDDVKISLTYKYIIHEDLLPLITNNNVLLAELDTYEWALKSWSQCSKPCGGGIQYTKYGCRRKSDSRLVHRNFCENSKKPKPIRKRCNSQECSPPTWVVEAWGPCSKSCGKLGYQTRAVQCMQALHNGTQRPVHSKHCPPERPDTRRSCNHTLCPAQWRTGAWSQCSVTCGEGIQQRQVVCKASDNTIGECGDDKPETVLICKLSSCPGVSLSKAEATGNSTIKDDAVHSKFFENPVSKISSNEPCLRDKSIFCQMEVLAQYCSIPGYNKLCCESCNKRDTLSSLATDLPDLDLDLDLDRARTTSTLTTTTTKASPTTALMTKQTMATVSSKIAVSTSRTGKKVKFTTSEPSTETGTGLMGAAAVTQSHGTNKPCIKDTSIFCQMDVLTRYCSIPGYNKLCCESCGKKETSDPPLETPDTVLSPSATHSPAQTTTFSLRRFLQSNPDLSASLRATASAPETSHSAPLRDSDRGSVLPPRTNGTRD